MNVGLTNRSVAEKISEELKKASEERYEHINKSLTENLVEGESAIIFTGNQDINIPDDIEKFIISPPELDQVAQWVKNAQAAMEAELKKAYESQAPNVENNTPEDKKDNSENSDSGLWTPS